MNKTFNKTRSAAIRAHELIADDALRKMSQYGSAATHQNTGKTTEPRNALKVTFLGGLDSVGEKNMTIIEYRDQAIVLDCGNNLGIDLPGVNYEVNDLTYLDSIKHKIVAYVMTHGHLDHIGGLRHTVPLYPAPIYGSRYTIDLVEKAFQDLQADTGQEYIPKLVTAKLDVQDIHTVGQFSVEFIRVTHSLPDAAAVSINTPVGRIIATGDFRLDPEPLDRMPTDISRLRELGDDGVLLLLSESSYADVEGRVPTESTLQQSFYDIIGNASGRIFVAAFSSNMNRTQMIINAAVAANRKVALDGRGMLSYAEIAVRQGILKVPKGTIVPIQQAATIPSGQVLVMCTGGQGEPNAALQRMSEGQHRHVNLNERDTVVISSSPIPGNEVRYDQISNRLKKLGVHLFRHPTHELDGCGPLHVSGHGRRDELREMIQLVRPKFLIPVHGGALRRNYHAELGIEMGMPRKHILLPDNGDSLHITEGSAMLGERVPHGSLLVGQDGQVASGVVIRDRLMLSEVGILTVVLTINQKTGQLVTSPDIISRGFIAMKDNAALMKTLREELRRAVGQRFKRVNLDRFKTEIRDHITHFIFEQTGQSPVTIPVVNVISGKAEVKTTHSGKSQTEKQVADADQKRFEELRARLLGEDQRD